MPIEFSDTAGGATDISGTPPPVQTKQKAADAQAKKQNQNERRPGKGSQQNPLEQAAGAVGGAASSAASDVGQAKDALGHAIEGAGFAQPTKSLNPVDWAEQYKQDASVPWGWARNAYKTLSGDYHDGVAGLFAGNDAVSKVGQQVAGFVADSIPFVGLGESFQNLQSMEQEREGKITDEQRKQQAGQHEEEAVQGAPGAAVSDASLVLPGSAAGRAAGVGIPLVEQLLGGNEDDVNSALMWAAAGSVLSFGHLPEPVRKALASRFGDWATAEKALTEMVQAKRDTGRAFQDPTKRAQGVKDWIGEQLGRGAMPSAVSLAARARKVGEPERVAAEVTPEGAIKLLPSEARANVKKLLNRVGVEDVDELVHKAQTEGINDPKLVKAIKDNWKALGLPYDLKHFHPDEMPLRDPRRHLDDLADAQAGQQHIASINHYLDQIHRGIFANHSNPMSAILRALAGHSRATNVMHQSWMASMVKLLGEGNLSEAAGQKLMQAAEGDEEAYQALEPAQKMVVDGWGLLRAAAREGSKGTDYASNFVPNWVPRTDREAEDMLRGRGRPSRASILSREARYHREESLQAGPGDQLVLGQRFKTVTDTNKALASARSNLIAILTNPEGKLGAELQNDPAAKAIHALSGTNPTGALEQAKTLAAQKYADKESNFLTNVNRVFANQVRAIHTQQAMNEFTGMLTGDGKAAALKWQSQRQLEEFMRQGYKQLDDARFRGFVFHPDLAANLNRYVSHASKGLRDSGFWGKLLGLEGKAVAAIMFSPLVHGLNVAGRMGIGALMHPLQMASYLKDGKALLPHQWDDASWSMRSEAYNAGVVPHFRGRSYVDNLLSTMQDALGDVEEKLPSQMRKDTMLARMGDFYDKVARPHRAANNYFWGLVNDYGVMMYHLERTAAERHGMEPEAAMEYAARRANSWMGMVAPEDTNPMIHDISRLFLFAPNWWRTWGELMVPLYKRAGFTSDPAYAKFAAYQSAKTISAALAFQKLAGNGLNYLATSTTPWSFDGHLQNENQPGQQDRIEATGGWLNNLPGFSGVAPTDPKTGARRTIENPLARQQLAVEGALGLASGHPDWKAEDTWDGMAKFLASRASPLLDATTGALNVDLYQSIADHQLRSVDPQQPAGSLSPASLLMGAIMMTPMGLQFEQNVAQDAAKGGDNPLQSALGTQVPTSLQSALKDIGDPTGRTAFSWFTGTNAPYATAQKSRGIKPSDQDYQRAKQLSDQYHQQMTVLSAQAMSGQMTPAQWRQQYSMLSSQHSAQMEALFKNSPDYVNGAEGMASQWEELYQQATDPNTGMLDQDRLSVLQAKFDQAHTPEQVQQMHVYLRQNDTKFQMLALYHKSQDQFDAWQEQWATQNNVDIGALRKEISGYGALFGDNQGQRLYLREHKDLNKYETAKKQQFDRTQAGMLHAMFYGNSAVVSRYLRAHSLTASQFAQQETAA